MTCKKDKQCPDGSHDQINITNNSSVDISWRTFASDSVYTINGSEPESDKIIAPNNTDKYGVRDCWEANFENGFSMYFFIFDNDTVQAIGWHVISGTNRGLLKRVKVDLNYLKSNNFKITYP